MVERIGDVARDAQRFLEGKLTLAIETPSKRLAVDARDDVEDGALMLAGIEQRKDVRMMQAGEQPNLSRESRGTYRRGELGVEHLQRDRPIVPQIAGAVHCGHAAAAEHLLDRVSAGKWCVKVRDRVVHAVHSEVTEGNT
jgi:hypothetical protein